MIYQARRLSLLFSNTTQAEGLGATKPEGGRRRAPMEDCETRTRTRTSTNLKDFVKQVLLLWTAKLSIYFCALAGEKTGPVVPSDPKPRRKSLTT